MLRIAYIIIFVFCVAATAYGILMANDLRRKKNASVFSNSIFYQQILIYVFGFYGIWGHILSKLIFTDQVSSNTILERISVSITLFALPFLLASWWFLIYIGNMLFNFKRKALLSSLILLVSIAFSGVVIYFRQSPPILDISFQVFMVENVLLASYLIVAVLLSKLIIISSSHKRWFVSIIVIVAILLSICANFYNLNPLIVASFILLFFIANTWLSFTFKYLISFPELKISSQSFSFSEFCKKYGISKRETEIIELISKGFTNKEIAEKLFITLQTVKDHTSRIYLKTEVKNRTLLANMVREAKK